MKKYIFYSFVVLSVAAITAFAVVPQKPKSVPIIPEGYESLDDYLIAMSSQNLSLGATRPAGLFTYRLSGAGISSSATSFSLASLTLPQNDYPIQDSDLSDTFHLTLEPGSTARQEFVSCTTVGANTGSSVSISGCTRGLSPITPYTASSTLQFVHPGGSAVIFSDSPGLLNQFAIEEETNTFTGINTFATTTDTLVKLYFGNAATDTDTYLWHNRTTGAFGFATSSSGELAWNSSGSTTFTPIIPITLTSGELKLATSSYDFVLDGNNLRIATSTVSSGTASGQRLDNYWNLRWNATTTHEGGFTFRGTATTTASLWVGSGGTANNLDLTGGDAYFQGDVEIDGGIFLSDTADIYRMATTTDLATSTDEQVGYVTLWTYSVPANIIGAHGILRLTFVGNCNVSSNGGCSIRVTYGGSTVCDGGGANLFIGGSTVDYRVICSFANGASTSAQYGVEGLLTSTSTHTFIPSNTSIDSSVAQNLLIRAIGTGGSATINLNQVYVEILK